jgi:hypothetical protein
MVLSFLLDVTYSLTYCPNFGDHRHHQPEEDIQPPDYPDVSRFDHVCIGGHKWAYTSYPIARYIKEIRGLENKPVSAFANFWRPAIDSWEGRGNQKKFKFKDLSRPPITLKE